jgi:cohesin loading factor subunit SCC2
MVLDQLSQLGNDLMRASSTSKSQLVEATYLATAMDAFGKITSHVAGVLRQNRENPLNLPDSMSPYELEPEEEVNRCFCGRGNLDTFMVDCDRCHSWYHGSCIGITKDTVPDQWFCDDCKLQTAMLDQAKVFTRSNGGSGALTSKDHNHVLRQFLLGYLSRIAQSSSSPQDEKTRQFLIASWVRDIMLQMKNSDGSGTFDLGLVRSYVIAQWSPPSQQQKYHSYFYLTDHANTRIMTTLVAQTQLSASFPQLLGVLLRLMGDGMTSLRKLSLKAFLQVANVDPALMTQPSVRKEVSRCFHDAAISVREAAVGLVGDYVLQSPNLAAAFHTPLLERLADVGISVRKRFVVSLSVLVRKICMLLTGLGMILFFVSGLSRYSETSFFLIHHMEEGPSRCTSCSREQVIARKTTVFVTWCMKLFTRYGSMEKRLKWENLLYL